MTIKPEKSCCFTGHRIIADKNRKNIETQIKEICEGLISRGIDTFITGGALGFDTLAAQCVLELKKKNDAKLIVAVPCKAQSSGWGQRDRAIYEEILARSDEVIVLSEEYTRFCMHRRNRFMVDNSAVCVAYLKKMTGGTVYTVNYAVSADKEVIFIK